MASTDALPTTPPTLRPRALDTILFGGLTVAVLDITNAITFWALDKGVAPTRIFQSVARGVLGKDAFTMGMTSAMLGAVLHTIIAFGVAAVFYVGCRLWPAPLLRRPFVTGPLYGLIVFAVMNYVVVPLSRAAGAGHPPLWLRDDLLGHAFLVGLPVALIARWSACR